MIPFWLVQDITELGLLWIVQTNWTSSSSLDMASVFEHVTFGLTIGKRKLRLLLDMDITGVVLEIEYGH